MTVIKMKPESGKGSPASTTPEATSNPKIMERVSELADPEPWDSPVTLAEALDEVSSILGRHIVLNDHQKHTVTLWLGWVHLHDMVEFSPILKITSPTGDCGKSTLLDLCSAFVPKPLTASSVSKAALFRYVDQHGAPMFIDEGDTFLRKDPEYRGIINSGWRRGSAWVVRCVGKNEVQRFSTWAPKVVAMLGLLHSNTETRCIVINMQKAVAGDKYDALPPNPISAYRDAHARLKRAINDIRDDFHSHKPEVPECLSTRTRDNWLNLLRLAEAAGGDWPRRAREAAVAISGVNTEDNESIASMLLTDIRVIFTEQGKNRISSRDLVVELKKLSERPWPEYGKGGKALSQYQLANLLKPFGIRPRQLWLDGGKVNGYELEQFEDAFRRYASPQLTQ